MEELDNDSVEIIHGLLGELETIVQMKNFSWLMYRGFSWTLIAFVHFTCKNFTPSDRLVQIYFFSKQSTITQSVEVLLRCLELLRKL